MSSRNHIEIATKTGYARFTLNAGWLSCRFYYVGNEQPTSWIAIRVQNEKAIFDGGWRLSVLQWLIDYYEPRSRKYE